MSDWAVFLRKSSCRQRERTGMTWSRLKFTNCILHNHTLRPGACPFPKHPVLLSTSFHACDKTLFSLLVISAEKKRELIKPAHILVKDPEEILASRVAIAPHCTVGLLTHFPTSRERCERFLKGLCRRTVCSRTALPLRAWHESAPRRRRAQ